MTRGEHCNRKQQHHSLKLLYLCFVILSISIICFLSGASAKNVPVAEQHERTGGRGTGGVTLAKNQRYALEFISVTRDAPHMKYASVAHVTTNNRGMIHSVEMLGEDWTHNDLFFFSSTATATTNQTGNTSNVNGHGDNNNKFVSFVDANEPKMCHSTSVNLEAQFSTGALNRFMSSLTELNKQQLVSNNSGGGEVYDERVNHILTQQPDLRVFMSSFKMSSDDENENESGEYLLVFMDRSLSKIHYIVGQHLFVSFSKFVPMVDSAQWIVQRDQIRSQVKELKSKCLSLDDLLAQAPLPMTNEFRTMKTMKSKKQEEQQDMKLPWFADRELVCSSSFLKDASKCESSPSNNSDKSLLRRSATQSSNSDDGKVCVFLHGAGEPSDLPPVTRKYADYWGSVHDFTPQCSERHFVRAETTFRGWDSTYLQKTFCALAADPTGQTNGTTIRDTIIFAHSMGNLILAAGIKNGYCSFDTASSSWYAINPPFGGSPAASKLVSICHHFFDKSPSVISFDNLYGIIATKGGYCNEQTKKPSQSYLSLQPGYCSEDGQCLDNIGDVVKAHVTGIMCGSSPFGLKSRYSILLAALAQIVGYGESNDGMVGVSSCAKFHGRNAFGDNYKDKFYLSPLNHSDGTCRNSNGLFGHDKMPCSYFKNKL